jgi:hypothetical protein
MLFPTARARAGVRSVRKLEMTPGRTREKSVGSLAAAQPAVKVKTWHVFLIPLFQQRANYPHGPMNGPFLSVETMMTTMMMQRIESPHITGVTSRW